MKKYLTFLVFVLPGLMFARNPQNMPPPPTPPIIPPPFMPIDGLVLLFITIGVIYSFMIFRKLSFKKQ